MPIETTSENKPIADNIRLLKVFIEQTGVTTAQIPVKEWAVHAQRLLDTTGMSLDEAIDFVTWAVSDNISDKPQYNSVAYIASAKDKFATLMKNSEALLNSYNRRKVVSTKVAQAKERQSAVRPLPRGIAKWLMTGPGVNQPLDGWGSARQKLDSVKRAWYGKVWEQQPDPEGLDIEAAFNEYLRHQAKAGIKKVNHA